MLLMRGAVKKLSMFARAAVGLTDSFG